MATLQELYSALRNADAAGDAQAAAAIARAIQAQKQQASPPPSQTQAPPSPAPVTVAQPQGWGEWALDGAKQFGSGALEGIDSLGQTARNLNPLNKLTSMGAHALESMGVTPEGSGASMDETLYRPNQREMIEPLIAAEDPNWAGTRKTGQFAGPSLLMGLPGIVRGGLAAAGPAIAKEIGLATTAAIGDTAGRSLADSMFEHNSWTNTPPEEQPTEGVMATLRSYVPGPEDVGGLVGAVVGGAGPTMVKGTTQSAVKKMFGDGDVPPGVDPASYVSGRDVWEAAKRQGLEKDITGGVVGNKNLASWEQQVAQWPIGGGRTAKKIDDLNARFGAVAQDASKRARAVYGPNGQRVIPGGASQKYALPENILSMADDNAKTIEGHVRRRYDDMDAKIGATTVLDPKPLRTSLKTQHTRASVVDQPAIKGRLDALEGDRRFPIDATVGKQLDIDMRDAQRRLKFANNPKSGATPADIASIEKEVRDLAAKIDKNTGVRYEHLKRQEGKIREESTPTPLMRANVPETVGRQAAKRMRAMRRNAAIAKGVPGSEFDEVLGNYRKTMFEDPLDKNTGHVPRLKDVAAKEAGAAENWLTADNLNRYERLKLMQDSADMSSDIAANSGNMADAVLAKQKFRQIAGDLLEGLGDVNPGQASKGSQFSADSLVTRLEKLVSPQSRQILGGADPSVMQSFDDLQTVGKGARSRGREINASRTQTQNAKMSLVKAITDNPIKGVGNVLRFLSYGKPLDMMLASEWMPRAVIEGGRDAWNRAALRAARVGVTDASLANEFGGPR
jgi:hypothetical protein